MERLTADIFLAMIAFDHPFVKHQNKNSLRYLEKYTHNLKILLSSSTKNVPVRCLKQCQNRKKNEERKWNYSH